MLVKTNITNYTLNEENILRDFDFAGLSFENPFKKKSAPKELFIAMSQPYDKYGILSTYIEMQGNRQYFYYLGEKGNTQFEKFRKDLQAMRLPTMIAAPVRVYSHAFTDEYVILQLLLGYLGADEKKWVDIPYGNYVGHIYAEKIPYTKETKGIQDLKVNGETVFFNRINYSKDKTIYVNVETWMPFEKNLNTEKKEMRKNKFVMELDDFCTYMIRVPWENVQRQLKEWKVNPKDMSQFKNWYVRGTYLQMVRNSMPYMTFFPNSILDDKLKIYIEFIDRVNQELGQYVTFTPVDKEFDSTPIIKGKRETEAHKAQLSEEIRRVILSKGITLFPSSKVQHDVANIIKDILIQEFHIPESKIRIYKDIQEQSWNLQILDSKDCYKDEDGKYDPDRDIYKISTTSCIQHLVTENFPKNQSTRKTVLQVCLVELLLKDCLLHRKMPSCMIPDRKITVATTRKIRDKANKDKFINEYFALTIEKDGRITETLHFNSQSSMKTVAEEEIEDKFIEMDASVSYKTLKTPEGIIRFDEGEYCGIYKTTQRPLPDYNKILEVFAAEKKQKDISIQEAIQIMDDYCQSLTKNKERITNMYEEVKEVIEDRDNGSGNINIKAWFDLIRKVGSKQTPKIKLDNFDKYLSETYPGRFIAQTHMKKEKDNPYEIDHLTGIHFMDLGDEIEYYVGLRKVASFGTGKTYRVGFPIRIVENDGSFTFPEYAKMLDVMWVRSGTEEPSVLPYPFKMLKEYIKAEDNKLRLQEMQ